MTIETSAPGFSTVESASFATRRSRGRWFFTGVAFTVATAVFIGFAPSFYLKAWFGSPALPRGVHIHGALFTAWVVLFLVQTVLVARRRTFLHRKLGVVGALLVVPMLASGLAVAIASARGEGMTSIVAGDQPIDVLPPLVGLVIPFTSVVLSTTFAASGLAMRRRPATHKRLMALATITMLPPALGRAFFRIFGTTNPALFFGVTILFIVAMIVHDRRTLGRVQPVSLWGGLLLAASFPGRLALGYTDTWQAFARSLVG